MEAKPCFVSEEVLLSTSCVSQNGRKVSSWGRSKRMIMLSVSVSRSCMRAVESSLCSNRWANFLWQEERRRGALALAVVAVGVSLTLDHPAMAEGDLYFVQSGHVMEDISATLTPRETLRLGFELKQTRLAQSSESSVSTGLRIELENISGKVGGDPGRDRFTGIPEMQNQEIWQGQGRRTPAVGARLSSDLVALSSGAVSVSKNSMPQQILSMSGASQILTRMLQHLGGGGLAGAVGAMVVYPLDTIKTRLQAQSKDAKYKDLLDCFRQVLVEEGLGSFYNGLVPQLLGIAPEKALKLTANEVMLGFLEQHLPGARVWALEFIAGGGGGFLQVLVTNPMEIVKLRLQIQSKVVSPKGLLEMVQELGLRGLYTGSGITLARDVPSSAIFFACYALLMQMYPDQRFWAGFVAAIPATIVVTPLDVIKTRLQMETPPGEEPYKDACHCFRVLLQQEGLKGLFKGGLLRVLRTSPQFGITLVMYSFFCDV